LVQLVNPLEERIVQRRFIGDVLRVGREMVFGFGVLADAPKFCGEGKVSGTVWGKQAAGFRVALRCARVIAVRGVHTAEAIPRLRSVGVVNKNPPVEPAGLVPTGKRRQAFSETQLSSEIIRPEADRGLKACHGGIEVATLHLY